MGAGEGSARRVVSATDTHAGNGLPSARRLTLSRGEVVLVQFGFYTTHLAPAFCLLNAVLQAHSKLAIGSGKVGMNSFNNPFHPERDQGAVDPYGEMRISPLNLELSHDQLLNAYFENLAWVPFLEQRRCPTTNEMDAAQQTVRAESSLIITIEHRERRRQLEEEVREWLKACSPSTPDAVIASVFVSQYRSVPLATGPSLESMLVEMRNRQGEALYATGMQIHSSGRFSGTATLVLEQPGIEGPPFGIVTMIAKPLWDDLRSCLKVRTSMEELSTRAPLLAHRMKADVIRLLAAEAAGTSWNDVTDYRSVADPEIGYLEAGVIEVIPDKEIYLTGWKHFLRMSNGQEIVWFGHYRPHSATLDTFVSRSGESYRG